MATSGVDGPAAYISLLSFFCKFGSRPFSDATIRTTDQPYWKELAMLCRPTRLAIACLVVWALAFSAPARTEAIEFQGDTGQFGELKPLGPSVSPVASAELSLRSPAKTPGQNCPTPATRSKNISVQSDVPSLRISTLGPDTLTVGKPAVYVVTLANLSRFAARDIVAKISVPTWVEVRDHQATSGSVDRESQQTLAQRDLVWNVKTVLGQASQTLSLTLVPTAGQAFQLGVDLSVRPSSSIAQIAVKEPKLDLNLTGQADVVLGETAAWKIALRNPGTGDAHVVNVEVYSDSEKVASQPVGTIEAGGQRVVELKLRPAAAGPGKLHVVATGELGLETNATNAYLVRRGQLQVTLQGPDFEYAGTKIIYEARVTNTGNAAVKDVKATLSLPRNAKYTSGLETPTVSATGVTWNIDRLDVGKEKTYQICCEPQQAGNHEFSLHANATNDLTAHDSVLTRMQSVADLKLDVLDPKGPRPVGSSTEYEIRLTNRGTDTARQISVIAVCSPEIEPIDVTGDAAIDSGQIFFRLVRQLEPGRTIVHKVVVRARKPGSHGFRVVVQCIEPETRLASDETTRFFVRPSSSRIAAQPLDGPTLR